MPEGRAPISSSRIAAGDIARHTFAIVRRGYDTDEVRAYLQSLSRSIEALEEREQELRDAAAEAEARAAHPVIDEATLTASLGQHSAQILRHAHEEAARIVAQAREDSAALLRETQSQVDELQTHVEASSAERVVEVELLVANAEQEARVESERIVAEAVAEGEAVVTRAKDEGRTLLEQVQEARRRVLADLAARRRTLGVQIEALRAARDEMAASVHGVRDRVDGILAHLDRTDDDARAAAQSVSEQFRLHGGPDGPHDQDDVDGVDGAMGEVPPTGPTPAVGGGDAPGGMDAEEGDGGGTPPGAPSVDELFARIRAGTGGAGAGAAGGADATVAVPVVDAAPPPPDEAPPGPRKGTLGDFRPFSLAVGDGGNSLYLVDWGFNGFLVDGPKTGRLFRLSYCGRDCVRPAPRPTGDSLTDRLSALEHPAMSVRLAAQRALAARGSGSEGPLMEKLKHQGHNVGRLHALWALDSIGSPAARRSILESLADADVDLRAQAARSVGIHRDHEAVPALTRLLGDSLPAGPTRGGHRAGKNRQPGRIAVAPGFAR